MKDYILVNTRQDYIYGEDPVYVYESNFKLDTEDIVAEAKRQAIKDKIDKRAGNITYNKYGTDIYKDRFKSSVTNPLNLINQATVKIKLPDTNGFDAAINKLCTDMMREAIKIEEEKLTMNCLAEKVIFNPPATIVYWKDKTKTVVKCQDGDLFDPEKGLVMAYFKKLHGNRGNYYNIIKKFVGDYPTPKFDTDDEVLSEILNEIATFIVTGKTPEMLKTVERHEWDDMPVPVIREAFDKGILNWDELDKLEYKVYSDQSKVKVEYKNGAKAVFDFSGVRSDNE